MAYLRNNSQMRRQLPGGDVYGLIQRPVSGSSGSGCGIARLNFFPGLAQGAECGTGFWVRAQRSEQRILLEPGIAWEPGLGGANQPIPACRKFAQLGIGGGNVIGYVMVHGGS